MWFGDLMVVTLVSRWLAVRKLIEIDQNEINLFHTTHWILTNKCDKMKFTKQGGSGNNWLYVLWRIVSQNLITLHSRISAAFSFHAVSNCVGHIVHVHFYSAFNCWLFLFSHSKYRVRFVAKPKIHVNCICLWKNRKYL